MRSAPSHALFLLCLMTPMAFAADSPAALRQMAHEYYDWTAREYPVASSDQGLHTWDDRLADFSAAATEQRRSHVRKLLERVRAMTPDGWPKDDRIDRILF